MPRISCRSIYVLFFSRVAGHRKKETAWYIYLLGFRNGTARTRSCFSRSSREEARKVAAVGETKSSLTRRYLLHVSYIQSAPLLPPYLSTDLLLIPSVLPRSPYRRIHATPSPLLCYLQQTARLCAPMGKISM